MGLQFKDLVVREEVTIKDFHGKVLAVDASNILYQFLTTIRGSDGYVLTDAQGRVTSHLIGLFSRATSLMEQGLKLVFVFDGKAPEIKKKTWEKRTKVKTDATLLLQEAEAARDIAGMRKYSRQTAVLTRDMVNDAKRVVTALGLPVVQAPSEGEAQATYMVTQGDAFATVSQDYDNLIFGCQRLIRNLSLDGKRKKKGTFGFIKIKPEIIFLKDVLTHLQITQDQLIVLAILIGTDYNPGGVKGIGPKTSLKLVKEHKDNFDTLFDVVEWKKQYPDLEWRTVFDIIKNIPVTDEYSLEWKKIDEGGLIHLLVKEHGFSEERVRTKLEKLKKGQHGLNQKGLQNFF
ncbi:flap endonuclease-1 [Candidatus Woesearchaeota archaeon CG10_big_fil_rev_8_21_14_0_10_36_11]|nr:MAG: flap endonuclease-1 [Candidatus Woesearchaeota archaeon CG10_big_fil_rev_8_21_14_0_10_36_11]